MSSVNLNNAFPEPANGGARGPLPKQRLFFAQALDEKGPKFVRYLGGLGSGKSVVGCATILAMALLRPGYYLISRVYMPELKATTYATFLEVLEAVGGKAILIDHKIADAEIHIRSNGGKSVIMFRGLDDPEKLKSLNLNAFLIDEAQQSTEAAFLLLQGRLRGRYYRKGLLTQNSGGMDWTYKWFVKQDHIKKDEVKKQFFNIKAPSTENVHLPEGYVETMLSTWSDDRIRREIYADETAFEGAVYPDFRQDVHVVTPYAIPEDWTKIIGLDIGYRNPTAAVFGAVDYDGNIHIYKEFYEKEWTIPEVCKGKTFPSGVKHPGLLDLMKNLATGELERIQGIYIDPSSRGTRGSGQSEYDLYLENLPESVPLLLANNEKTAGIDRVKTYMKVNKTTGKPRIHIFNTCKNLIDELAQYRYQELTTAQQGKRNDKEEPVKYHDHACFVAGTLVATPGGQVPIEQVRPGDLVMTTLGPKRVLVSGMTGLRRVIASPLGLTGTPDHPVLLQDGSKKALGELTDSDIPVKMSEWKSNSTVLCIARLARITELTVRSVCAAGSRFIEKCGSFTEALYPTGIMFTTSMGTRTTTTFQTSNVFLGISTSPNTASAPTPGAGLPQAKSICGVSEPSPRSGTTQKLVGNGIGNMLGKLLRIAHAASRRGLPALFAGIRTLCTRTSPISPSIATSIADKRLSGSVEKVYNLAVEGISEYFANGILVSNCDALRYLVMSRPEIPQMEEEIWEKLKYSSLEGRLYRDLETIKAPKQGDPFKQGF